MGAQCGTCLVFDPSSCDVAKTSAEGGGPPGVIASVTAKGMGTYTTCIEVAQRGTQGVFLSTEPLEEKVLSTAYAYAAKGRPKASAIAMLQTAAKGGNVTSAVGAAACARLSWSDIATSGPAAKRTRLDNGGELAKVRCRQILLKYTGCRKPGDQVRRKPVERSTAEAEVLMKQVLDDIEAMVNAETSVDAAFTQHCRQYLSALHLSRVAI